MRKEGPCPGAHRGGRPCPRLDVGLLASSLWGTDFCFKPPSLWSSVEATLGCSQAPALFLWFSRGPVSPVLIRSISVSTYHWCPNHPPRMPHAPGATSRFSGLAVSPLLPGHRLSLHSLRASSQWAVLPFLAEEVPAPTQSPEPSSPRHSAAAHVALCSI